MGMADFRTRRVLASEVEVGDWVVDSDVGVVVVVERACHHAPPWSGGEVDLTFQRVDRSGVVVQRGLSRDTAVDVAVDVPTAEIRFEADALAKLPTWLPVDGAGSWVLTGQHPRQSRPGWLRCNADLPTEFTSAIPAEIEFPELWVAWIITR